jgi:hypothetical protein
MKTFKEVLSILKKVNEMSPMAMQGDWSPPEVEWLLPLNAGPTIMTTAYTRIESLVTSQFSAVRDLNLEVYVFNSNSTPSNCYDHNDARIGRWVTYDGSPYFEVLGILTFERDPRITCYGDKAILVSGVKVGKEWRGVRLGTVLYLTLIYNGYAIVSDEEQYDNARKLWRSLSINFNDVVVDVFDIRLNRVIKTNHVIQNTDFSNLDSEWGIDPQTDADKYHIRYVAHLK